MLRAQGMAHAKRDGEREGSEHSKTKVIQEPESLQEDEMLIIGLEDAAWI